MLIIANNLKYVPVILGFDAVGTNNQGKINRGGQFTIYIPNILFIYDCHKQLQHYKEASSQKPASVALISFKRYLIFLIVNGDSAELFQGGLADQERCIQVSGNRSFYIK